jgi:tetratricopeptide (TPR) repeat protein
LRRSGELPASGGSPDAVQAAAKDAADLAASLGLLFERADALFLAGQDLADRGQFAEALQRFEEALEIADTIEAADLATAVRERLVDIHGRQGDVSATSEVLQAIESQLLEDGANDELAQNLLAQGRILNDTYRYEEARKVLQQALTFEHNSATRNQVRLALAEASWALGDLDEAWAQARAAVTHPETGDFRRPTPVLDVQRGVAILAGVARARNERQRLREMRNAQRRLLEDQQSRTRWAWERAQDELETGRPADAAPFLRQVRDASGGPSQASLGNLARLWLCRLKTDCAGDTAARAWQSLRESGVPRHSVEGAWLRARLMLDAGRTGDAARALEFLVGDMTFLRYSIPGVLGAQYWRRVDVIASDLLAARRATGRDDLLLLDLARLRWLRASGGALGLPFDRAVAGLDTDGFRALLARREQPGAGDAATALAREIESQLGDGRARFDAVTPFLGEPGQAAWLAALEDNAAVLDFDLSGDRALALLADGRGVRRFALGPSSAFDDWPRLLEALPSMDEAALAAAADRWGRRFLAPLTGRLPTRIYLAAADALGYLPFERFLVDGNPLGARHSLVRLASYPARPAPAMRLASFNPQSVFLAGAPVDFSAGFLARLETGDELRTVMNRFVGPGLQVIQGTALAPDEFQTMAFRAADLVHLATPARVSLVRPAASALELSEARGGAGRHQEPAAALADWTLDAHLLVLSQARIEGAILRSPGRPPLVAGALASGSGAVLASAWAGTEASSAAFMDAFYAAVADGRTLDQALTDARAALADSPREALRHQLWVD